MNKTKIILSVVGGTLGLIVLVMAYLAWSAISAKDVALLGDEEEGTDGLETVQEKANTLMRKAIFPCAASVRAIESNTAALAAWQDEAFLLASKGDRPVTPTTPAAFKEFIVADAKRVAALPAAVGPLAAEGFDFGPFKPYILEGKMPAEAELAALQRKWDDVSTIAELLSTSGVSRLTGVAIKEKTDAEKAAQAKPEKKTAKKAKGKKGAEKKAAFNPSTVTYIVSFQARPTALVACVNLLAKCERFLVVDDFTFQRTEDVIVAALGGGEKKKEAEVSSGRRARRGRRAATEKTETDEKKPATKNGIVTDPLSDPPFAVTMTVSVYDFGSLEMTKEETK